MVIFYNLILLHISTFIAQKMTRKIITGIILSMQLLSFMLGLALFKIIKKTSAIEMTYEWLRIAEQEIRISFIIESFTIMFVLLITGITMVVMLYSVAYLGSDPYLPKFLAYLGIFCFSMIWLCVSNNMLTLFIGWEFVGLASYLLISFWSSRNEASVSALKAVFINRIGDVFLLFAIILTIINIQTSDIVITNTIIPQSEIVNKYVIIIFLCLAACAKSAQLFLHTWLPDAMEGPTPVSSLLHSATMVTAGVFLIIKMYVFMGTATEICYMFAILGLVTAIIAAIFGSFQYDIKKIIAYSTTSQLGLLFFTATLGTLFAATYHLVTHAFFKCLLFLCSGVIIHANMDEQDIRKISGLYKLMPLVYIIFGIGSFSLMGFIFMSGYYSKEFLLETLFCTGVLGMFLFIFATLGVFFSAFYSGRLLYLVFLKSIPSFKKFSIFFEGDKLMYISLFILTIFSILAGHLFFFYFTNTYWNDTLFFNHYIPLLEFELNSSNLLAHLALCLAAFGFFCGIKVITNLNFKFLYALFVTAALKFFVDNVYSCFINCSWFLGKIAANILDAGYFSIPFFVFRGLKLKNIMIVTITFYILFLIILCALSFEFLHVYVSLWIPIFFKIKKKNIKDNENIIGKVSGEILKPYTWRDRIFDFIWNNTLICFILIVFALLSAKVYAAADESEQVALETAKVLTEKMPSYINGNIIIEPLGDKDPYVKMQSIHDTYFVYKLSGLCRVEFPDNTSYEYTKYYTNEFWDRYFAREIKAPKEYKVKYLGENITLPPMPFHNNYLDMINNPIYFAKDTKLFLNADIIEVYFLIPKNCENISLWENQGLVKKFSMNSLPQYEKPLFPIKVTKLRTDEWENLMPSSKQNNILFITGKAVEIYNVDHLPLGILEGKLLPEIMDYLSNTDRKYRVYLEVEAVRIKQDGFVQRDITFYGSSGNSAKV